MIDDEITLKSTAAENVEGHSPTSAQAPVYEIHVRGHLNSKWSEWLEGLVIELRDNGEMILVGPIVDQAALIGLLNKFSRLNLTLLSLNEVQRTS